MKKVIIVGATSGIGKELAKIFSQIAFHMSAYIYMQFGFGHNMFK